MDTKEKLVTHSSDSLTRRRLLGQALGAAALVSSLDSASQLFTKRPDASARIRDSFDFEWKFFKGDAAATGLRRLRLAQGNGTEIETFFMLR